MKTKILLSIIAILFVTILCFLYLRFQKPVVSNIDTKPTPSISSQSADPTSNWQTYKNDQYGFEFQYPEELTLKTKNINRPNDEAQLFDSNNNQLINIDYVPSFSCPKETCKLLAPTNFGNTTFVPIETESGELSYIVNNTYRIWVNTKLDKNNISPQILSTFKFTPDTSTWKTFKNTERNYEIKYPQKWYIAEDSDKNIGLYISNKPISQVNDSIEPTDGQLIVQVFYFHSAFENGLGKTEHLSENGKDIVSDTKYIADSNSFGVVFKYQKSDPNINELLTTASEILSSLWVNYHNEKYGVSFMHPVYYEIKEVDEGNMYYANSILVNDTKHLVSDWTDESGKTLIPKEIYKISPILDFEQICPKDRCRSEEKKYINRGGNKFTRVFGETAGYNFYSSKGIYLFSFEDENEPITSRILSSFSFFDSPVKILSPDINHNYLSSPIHITGKINKSWVFEGTFPIKLLDNNGQVLYQGVGSAPDWTKSGDAMIDFTANISFTSTAKTGFLVISKDNPSGLSETKKSFRYQVFFK
ncbi:MAG TPA: Gmad2 immunoglobulin-like domain-containing protein [Candidatus Woesebacteria bacterium]|nr:Gmad2 immunoglobulin-like domain-containing protein [Candidatus Woesebacteria bacterium]